MVNGTPAAPRPDDFYCKLGNHYVLALKFEREPGNKGVCLSCAFKVYELLRGNMTLPTIAPRDEIRLRKQWESTTASDTAKAVVKGTSNDPGWVYYVSQGDLIKIGYATDVTKRIRAYGPTAVLLAVHPGTPALEKRMHAKFRASLHSGREWFNRDADLMAHIDSVLTTYGDPSPFEHEWSTPRSQEDKVRAMFDTPEFPVVAQGAHYAGR